jgi:hypothetical protein
MLVQQVFLDKTASIDRLLTDCVIDYVMGVAEQSRTWG